MIEVNNHLITADISDIIDKLKFQLSLNGINRFYKTIKSVGNLMVCCPFHNEGQEKKPSMGILEKDKGKDKAGTCHCFACGWTGSIQELVSHCLGVDDFGQYGAKWLISNFVTLEIENRPEINLNFERNSNENSKELKYISETELDNYRYYHPYMYKRKLTDEIIDLFDIGYDKNTECITFPVRDGDGNCLFVARRSVKTKFFNYPSGTEKPVYGLYECNICAKTIKNWFPDEIIICESMIDALTCWVYGKYAVALNGLGNELQFSQLRKLPCRKFILATDNDNAGMKARDRIRKALSNKLVTEYVFPEGVKDINDMTKEQFDNLKEVM